ncbi:zinc finger MYND domain-containing protein 15-like isoform X2 [Zingiber officinale]|uniref:zinc finger MYND domain-containing protein 15-like isoform X2 n=1 Tax=Zingiber officinale TaxID=94328 RepID=UPI001C4C8043|nr:zinc finger MYND domain-containing protein 15-like isoform X2 [Zingiber officinale]
MASNAPAEQGRRRRWPTVTECAARGSETPCTQGLPTRRCGLCGAVAYCSTNHQISHWSEHRKECARLEEQMKRMDVLSDFPFTFFMQDGNESRCSMLSSKGLHQIGLWKPECSCGSSIPMDELYDDWTLPSSLCPCHEPRSQLSSCLSCWDDYYQWRHLPLHSPVALLLHWPLTVYHCFQVLSAHSSISKVKAELNIHYLGPEKELLQLGVFRELLALFPGVQIYLNLVGPAVPQFRDGETVSLCKYLPCAEESCICKSLYPDSVAEGSNHRNATIRIRLHKGFYHDRYRTIIKDSYPHLIIAPNAGVAAYSSWLPTVELIKGMGIPAIFTDFCEEAANLAANCISSVTGQPLRLPIQINPFRQPMVVEDSVLYLPCYSNCFLFGM